MFRNFGLTGLPAVRETRFRDVAERQGNDAVGQRVAKHAGIDNPKMFEGKNHVLNLLENRDGSVS
jgi:hypothetical protein